MPLLNDAKTCYVGTQPITKIYAGTQLVWPDQRYPQISNLQLYYLTKDPDVNNGKTQTVYATWEVEDRSDCDMSEKEARSWNIVWQDPTAQNGWRYIGWRSDCWLPDHLPKTMGQEVHFNVDYDERTYYVGYGGGTNETIFGPSFTILGGKSSTPNYQDLPPLPMDIYYSGCCKDSGPGMSGCWGSIASNCPGPWYVPEGIQWMKAGTMYAGAKFNAGGISNYGPACAHLQKAYEYRLIREGQTPTAWKPFQGEVRNYNNMGNAECWINAGTSSSVYTTPFTVELRRLNWQTGEPIYTTSCELASDDPDYTGVNNSTPILCT